MTLAPFKDFIQQVVDGKDLSREEAQRAFQIVMKGGATPAQMGALLVALRIKGETVDELTGAALTMRQKALQFMAPENAIDTCGTGGDSTGTYNISTATAIVTAACGVPVVKHGNRSVSSKSGSADVMAKLDVNLTASHEIMQQALDECNLCFLMAPSYHKATRHVAPIRQELGLRTLFNLLGPLSNPASVKRQLMGVYDIRLIEPLANVLRELGATDVWVVHGHGGLDEISLTGETHIVELKNGKITRRTIHPHDAGLDLCEMKDLKGGDATYNAQAIEQLLAGHASAYRDIVCLNSAASLIVAGKTDNLRDGVAIAQQAIDSTNARHVLNKLIEITNQENLLNE